MSHDDIDIELVGPSAREVPRTQPLSPDDDPTLCVHLWGRPLAQLPRVYFHQDTIRDIEGHAAAYPEREVGGVLLGRRVTGPKPFLVVEKIIRGIKAEGSATRLTFTTEALTQIIAIKDRDYPDLLIVGWYHTHPGLSVFMSRDDLYIQENFFREHWQIALVVDPLARDRALFVWQGKVLMRDEGLRLYNAIAARQPLEQYVAALNAPPPARAPERFAPPTSTSATAPSGAPVVKLEFHNASINICRIVPAGVRRFFGVEDLTTAPRLSLKSLLIWVLLTALVAGGVHYYHTVRVQQRYEELLRKVDALSKTVEGQGGPTPATPEGDVPPEESAR